MKLFPVFGQGPGTRGLDLTIGLADFANFSIRGTLIRSGNNFCGEKDPS
jgi:hypothetical protein